MGLSNKNQNFSKDQKDQKQQQQNVLNCECKDIININKKPLIQLNCSKTIQKCQKISCSTSTTDLRVLTRLGRTNTNPDIDYVNCKDCEDHCEKFSILDFCDEILIEILINLDTLSLLSVGRTCQRLHYLVKDFRLWQYIDLTGEQLLFQDIANNLTLMNYKTKSIKIRGMVERYPRESWRNVSLNKNLLQHIAGQCENLQILELHHCLIDTMTKSNEFFMQIDITYFPKNLKRLVFNDCYVCWPNTLAFLFCGIDSHLKGLEDLRIEFCNWFSAHDLLSFSKISNLKHLSIRGCSELKEFVPYGNIAIRFGFKNLESLDLRETPITDTDFSYFNKLKNLKELLVECPIEPNLKNENSELSAGCVVNSTYNNHGVNNINTETDKNKTAKTKTITTQTLNDRTTTTTITRIGENVQDIDIDESDENGNNNSNNNNNNSISQTHRQQQQQQSYSWEMIHASGIFVSLPKISDRGICSYGILRAPNTTTPTTLNSLNTNNDPSKIYCTTLEKLTIKNYDKVTDISLRHLSLCAPKLKYLNITGCGITKDGLKAFKTLNLDCKILSHLTNL